MLVFLSMTKESTKHSSQTQQVSLCLSSCSPACDKQQCWPHPGGWSLSSTHMWMQPSGIWTSPGHWFTQSQPGKSTQKRAGCSVNAVCKIRKRGLEGWPTWLLTQQSYFIKTYWWMQLALGDLQSPLNLSHESVLVSIINSPNPTCLAVSLLLRFLAWQNEKNGFSKRPDREDKLHRAPPVSVTQAQNGGCNHRAQQSLLIILSGTT